MSHTHETELPERCRGCGVEISPETTVTYEGESYVVVGCQRCKYQHILRKG